MPAPPEKARKGPLGQQNRPQTVRRTGPGLARVSTPAGGAPPSLGKANSPVDAWRHYRQAVCDRITDYSFIYHDLPKQRASTNGWSMALCPFHADHSPSFSFNRLTGRWRCFAGCGEGDALDYLMRITGMNFKEVLLELGDQLVVPRPRQEQPPPPPIREELVAQWVTSLHNNTEVRRWLADRRGLSMETIERYALGWNARRARITIPVRDEGGRVVNVRLYHPGKQPKFLNYTDGEHGYGSPPRLYGLDEIVQHQGQQVILCEGELDRLLLQQAGFMAVTGTHGASTFRPEWLPFFRGKHVVLVYDCDEPGQTAARDVVLPQLEASGVRSVKNIVLPLTGRSDDKDVTDYLYKHGFTAADLQQLIDETPPYPSNAKDGVQQQQANQQGNPTKKGRKVMPRVNFNKIDDIGPLPAGTYRCQLDDVEVDETRNGDELWKLRFKVEAGPYKGRSIWDNLAFSGAAMPRVKLISRCLGVDTSDSDDVDLTPEMLRGHSCDVVVEIDHYEDQEGKTRRRNSVPFAGYKQTDNEEATGAGAHGVVPPDGNDAHAEDAHTEDDIPF